MKRAAIIAGFVCLALLLAGCNGSNNNNPDDNQPLEIRFVAASPSTGVSPLRVFFTANILGGVAPYYYSWDFANDGAVDVFDNNQFSTTVSVFNEYFRRVSDADQDSVYEAILTVTDSDGNAVTSDPVVVTVLAQGGLSVVPEQSFWFTNETDSEGNYLARVGEPVFFRVQPSGGEAPYEYEWDFDNDGQTDSRIQNPQHTFFHNEPGAVVFPVCLTITDTNGVVLPCRDDLGNPLITDNVFYVAVAGPGFEFPEVPGFAITLSSSPAASAGDPHPIIDLKYDSSGSAPGLPTAPELDLSVVVDPLGEMGIPPFEYYWDFDNDGAIEGQDPSPTIPFYDQLRKILRNPYTHTEDTKTFTLRCLVIDGTGFSETVYRTVVVKNVANAIDLSVDINYGVTFEDGNGIPYGQVSGPAATTNPTFNVDISGSTGIYDYQFDANGDGTPEIPAGGGFEPVSGNTIVIDASNLPPFLGPGYFPCQLVVRSLQGGAPTQTVRREVPISLVERTSVSYEGPTLVTRRGASAEASWTTSPGGGNGTFLENREMIIVGGMRGVTPIGTVERVTEAFQAPDLAGEFENTQGAPLATVRLPLTQARRGSMMWTEGQNFYVHGGETTNGTIVNTVEVLPIDDNNGLTPWTIVSPLTFGGFTPLRDGLGATVFDVNNTIIPYNMNDQSASIYDALFFCGGVHPPTESDADNVNASINIYRSFIWPDADPMVPPQIDGYVNIGVPMITPRFEGHAVFNPTDRRIYVMGGRTASGQSIANVETFDVDVKKWINLPPMQDPRAGGVAKLIGGQIYVLGGAFYPSDEGELTVVDTAEVYNPVTGVWSYTLPPTSLTRQPAAASMPGPGAVSDAGTFVNTIWYTGGDTDQGETNVLEEFVYFYSVQAPPAP